MALPVTISGIKLPSQPFISSGGNVYVLAKDSTDESKLRAFKATDPTSSFSNIGTDFDVDSGAGILIRATAAFQLSDVLHIITSTATITGNTYDLKYHTFNMATDAWVVTNETVTNCSPLSSNGPTFIALSVRSDGDVIALYNGDAVANMGSDRERVYYARREGGSWTVDVSVDDGGGTHWSTGGIVRGSSDRMHFFFMDGNADDGYQRTLTSANVLQTFPSSFDTSLNTNDVGFQQTGVSYVSGAATKVRYPYTHAGGTIELDSAKCDSADAPTMSRDSDIAGTLTINGAFDSSLSADGTTLWNTFTASADSDLYTQSNVDDGGWDTPASFFAGTIGSVLTNIYTRGSNVVLAMVFTDGSAIKYHEKLLSAGGPQGDANLTLAAVTTTADGTVSVGGDGSLSVGNITTTTDASVSLSGDANFTLDAVTTTTDAEPLIVGDASLTLDAITVAGTGVVGFPEILGDASLTLDAVTVTTEGDVSIIGDASLSLDAVTITADASTPVTGDASLTLDPITTTADATAVLEGNASLTLDDVTLTADATAVLEGNASFTLGDVTTTADASIPVTGDASLTLDAVTTTANGTPYRTRLYLTDVNNTLTGTFPTDSTATSPLTPYDYAVADAATLKLMTIAKGDSPTQVLKSGASLASTDPQVGFYGMWVSPPLSGNQTIVNGAININLANAQSNLEMNLGASFTAEIYVWRPSTGTKVGTIQHNLVYSGVAENQGGGSTRVDHGTSTASTEVSALDGDVIICEYFHHHTQDTATSRNGFAVFDGQVVNITTNASVSAHASFLEFAALYAFQGVDITGNASLTLDSVTTTADGSVSITGNASIDAATTSIDQDTSDGDVLVSGDTTLTLDDITLTGEGSVIGDVTGSASFTLDAITLLATGSVTGDVVVDTRGGDDAPPRRRKHVPASDKPNPDKLLDQRMEETLDELVNPRPQVTPTSEEDPPAGQTAAALAEALLPLYTLPKQRVYRPGRKRLPPPLSDKELLILLLMVM